jgi:hypothetical protein
MGCDHECPVPPWIPSLGETPCHELFKGRTPCSPPLLSSLLFTFIRTFPDHSLPLPELTKAHKQTLMHPPWSAMHQACPGFIRDCLLPHERPKEITKSQIFLSMMDWPFCPHQKWWTYFCDIWTYTIHPQSCCLVLCLCLPSSPCVYCDPSFPWGTHPLVSYDFLNLLPHLVIPLGPQKELMSSSGNSQKK